MPLERLRWLRVEAVPECWTIDHTTGAGDNGFLDAARSRYPQSRAHDSTAGAATNMLNCFYSEIDWEPGLHPVVNANIVGHGAEGSIVTGTGQNANDTAKYIA